MKDSCGVPWRARSDQRYKYFSMKIQDLMRKKLILEEMKIKTSKENGFRGSVGGTQEATGDRKEEYDMQMYLSNDQVNRKKVKEIVDIADNRLKRYETKVQSKHHQPGQGPRGPHQAQEDEVVGRQCVEVQDVQGEGGGLQLGGPE